MGKEIVVLTPPSELFMPSNLVIYDEDIGAYVRVMTLCSPREWLRFRRDRAALLRKFPGAHFRVAVTDDDIWHPPREPNNLSLPGQRSGRLAHRRAVRASLETFLNAKLAGLRRMVRTGWWILEEARACIVRFTDVSDRPSWRIAKIALDGLPEQPFVVKAKKKPSERRLTKAKRRRMPMSLAEFSEREKSVEQRQLEELRDRGSPAPRRPRAER